MVYAKIYKALRKNSNLVSNNLRRKLKDVFKFEAANQPTRLSRINKIENKKDLSYIKLLRFNIKK